nr:nucleoside deaminase [Candidatus Bandiella woodruffii]
MVAALEEAMKAGQNDEVPVGAVITYNGAIISQSHNLVRKNMDPTAHAEVLCIRAASQKLSSYYLDECDIYVTLEPCAMCAQAIAFSKIKRLYFGAYDEKFGAIENGVRLFNAPISNHKPEIYGGIEQEKTTEIIQTFFSNKRGRAGILL